MAKKPTAAAGSGRGRLWVTSPRRGRQRFLRGMITHDLVQRGLSFDDAYAAARAVRDQLADRQEVSTAELRQLIQTHLERAFGGELPAELTVGGRLPAPALMVTHRGRPQPFSRGLLARSIHAAGLDFDRAYRLVTEVEAGLVAEGLSQLPREELVRRVSDQLERHAGSGLARRYRLMRQINRLPRPLVIYVGGASGTGKSTLSLELAPLLRIYRINATDTIRQVMRMIFSPQVLPALYTSSFEVERQTWPHPLEVGSAGEGEGDEMRVIASFEEQAARVAVGVRAIVERAIAEHMSVIIEGVHLYPPLVPFPDLEGAVYQVPILLSTLDDEIHRSRFLARAHLGRRRAERYLENFRAIRQVHDFLVNQADAHDVPLLDTGRETPPVAGALRLITGLIERQVPGLGSPSWQEPRAPLPTLLLIIDGLADRPVRALGGRTPLSAARTPTLDRLAREGQCGLADPVAPGVVPDTAAGSLALFGQSPLAMKRGPVEALGAGLRPSPGDVALRGNFATLDPQGHIADRRAGRIRQDAAELARALDRLPIPGHGEDVEVRVKAATEHRLAILLRGEGLSSAIRGSDPGDGAPPGAPLVPAPIDPHNDRAVATAGILALFEQEARRVLARHPVNARRVAAGLPPANAVLTRGAGRLHQLPSLEQTGLPLRVSCISGDRTVLGLAGWLGAETITSAAMTANLDTDLGAKLDAAAAALDRSDLVILHVKGADIAAHDRRPDLKAAFLERIDAELGRLLASRRQPFRVAVAADHATLSESGQHAADPLPVLIWGEGLEADEVEAFDEQAAGGGVLQRFPLQLLLSRLFQLS
ncbi:MAG: 2,3-bisphosphoglycerate-independent phosphoglycerate mutase [Acidobacteria bacterium]|nr:MAG: 2,3-bisphosphoglycerate-independent phosphoglycerate mutase [Acidobacteriota bacterium]